MSQKTYSRIQWTLFSLACILPALAWGQNYNWQIGALTGYQWFPLFGLLAWMIMWTHYINGAIRLSFSDLKKTKLYAKTSAYLVLMALLLHPGILAFVQYQNNQGLPVESFIRYVGDGLALAVLLGSLSLVIFLSFEVFERIKDRPRIKQSWHYISFSQSLAMLLVYVHALRLGTIVVGGWFGIIWILCGLALIPSLYIIHSFELTNHDKPRK